MRTGLYFGSFNPIHVGHLIIGDHIRELAGLDRVLYVVSPRSPFKSPHDLLDEKDRLYMVTLALEGNSNMEASDIEFHMPVPSYTIDTIHKLKQEQPGESFELIMGEDNLKDFDKWKSYEEILELCPVHVYKRDPSLYPVDRHTWTRRNINFYEVPLINISSTYIRRRLSQGKSIRYLVPENVYHHLLAKRHYQ